MSPILLYVVLILATICSTLGISAIVRREVIPPIRARLAVRRARRYSVIRTEKRLLRGVIR